MHSLGCTNAFYALRTISICCIRKMVAPWIAYNTLQRSYYKDDAMTAAFKCIHWQNDERKKGCKNGIFLYWKFNPFKSATQKMALQFKIWLFLFTERWFECSLLSIDFFCIVLSQIHVQNESNDFWLSNNERAQRGWKQLSHFSIADEYIALVKANS